MDSATTIAERIRNGAVALLPTDTVYGLAAHPERPEAIERIFFLKRRPPARNLPVMLADREQIPALGVVLNPNIEALLSSPFVPGPMTIAAGFGDAPRPAWLAGRVEVAFRIPDDDFIREILRSTGPLLVTSANAHGVPTPEIVADIVAALAEPPDIVVDRGRLSSVPSTLVNCRLDPPVVERVGVVSEADVLKVLSSWPTKN